MNSARTSVVTQVQSLLRGLMEDRDVDKASLATRMGVEISTIDRLFSSDASDMGLSVFAEAAHALGGELELRLARTGT